MKNPFLFGVVVKEHDFCDREEEINEIISDLNSKESVLLHFNFHLVTSKMKKVVVI